jgi:MFS family permease
MTFVSTGFFGGFADILTQRLIIDTIPNRIRNSMYSLQPAIATILAMPQIALFGWLTNLWGFPLTLVSCGLVSLAGVLMIKKGMKYPLPVVTDLAAPSPIVKAEEAPSPVAAISSDDNPDPADESSP